MDSALNLLKEEINKTNEAEHDLAKWKLGVTAALGAAAFGLADKTSNPNYWLLLLVPFVCAYIDLYAYQYQFRILVIARFLREHPEDDAVLQSYEELCERRRREGIFSLGSRAGIACSLGASLLGPLLYLLRRWHESGKFFSIQPPLVVAGVLWFVGVLLIVSLWGRFKYQAKKISSESGQQLNALIKPGYSRAEIRAISAFLENMGTLTFAPLPNGLFPAAALGTEHSYTGYSYVWVRDNIHIAHAHFAIGRTGVAVGNVRTLMAYFIKYQKRFLDIIDRAADADIPMNRPHIRFDGNSLEEVKEKWSHAQNDALGYFLWMFSKLVNEKALTPGADELKMLALFPLYFEAIRYWQDEDSGHWEEARKISASSIGVVVAGLTEFRRLLLNAGPLRDHRGTLLTAEMLELLIEPGRAALERILPSECIESDPLKQRRYDAALLFLIYPLQIVEGQMADRILADVIAHLQGKVGIRRYFGDSYWAPDYKKKLKPAERTAEVSDNVSGRDRLLSAVGQEAQWCIFDPTISCIFGLKFKSTRSPEYLAKQTEYLNRSLGQITAADRTDVPGFRCPELYYLEAGRYVPNDHVPLLWTQANLMLAMKLMEDNCLL
jgi:hypothetical protein